MNISKKTAIILILGVVILLIGLFLYFYLSPDDSKVNNTGSSTSTTPIFGDTSETNTYPDNAVNVATTTDTQIEADKPEETLRQIFSEPTSGSVIYTKNKDSFVRFVERSNGNIYEVRKDSPQIIRLTNKTIPKIQEAVWDKNAGSVVLRYLNDDKRGQIDSFSGKIKISTSTSNEFFGDITGVFLPANIPQLITNPSSGKIAYLQEKFSGEGSYIYTSNTDGSGKIQIADIPLTEINIFWPKENTIAVLTKPSSRYAGFLYFVNTQEGILKKVIGNKWGLSTQVNTQANKVIYSEIVRGEPILNIYNISTGEDVNLQIKTFADKCVWGKKDTGTIFCAVPKSITQSGLPDVWYQGLVSLSDDIWKIDLETGRSSVIYDMNSKKLSIDAVNLSISDKDDLLVFTNKTDLSLWGLVLE